MATERQREAARKNAYSLTPEQRKEKQPRKGRVEALANSDPLAFEQLMKRLASKMLVPHSDGQHEVLTADERFLVLCAGRRWGKSQVGAARAIRHARKPNQIVWWVAPTYKNVKHGYKAVTDQLPKELLVKPAPPDSVFDAGRSIILQLKNGSRIQFFSASLPEGMLGGSCDLLVLDEAATMDEHVWTVYLRATLADRQGSALFISTPRSRNWFYYLWQRGQSDDPDDKEWRSWRFPSYTNPTIPEAEWEEAKRDMPAVEYEQEVLAEFISEASAVFRFPRAINPETKQPDPSLQSPVISPLVEPYGHVTVGLDLAKHADWTVIFAIRDDGRPCYHDRFQQVSWPMQFQRITDAIALIEQTASGVTILVDSGGPGDVIYDTLEEAGYDVIPINFTTYKEKMVKLLSSDLENSRAFILEEQLSEFNHYSYSITGSGRWKYEALRGHDDEVSAALLAHWGRIHEGAPNVQTVMLEPSISPTGAESYGSGYDQPYHDSRPTQTDDGVPKVKHINLRSPEILADVMNNPAAWN